MCFLPLASGIRAVRGISAWDCRAAALPARKPRPRPPDPSCTTQRRRHGRRQQGEGRKEEEKCKEGARGDRSITNHYGPSGTAKRTSTTIRRVLLSRSTLLGDLSRRANYIIYFPRRFGLRGTEERKRKLLN